jgi:hypothetical protein
MEQSDKMSSTIVWDAAFEQHLADQRSFGKPIDFEAAARDADSRVRGLMPSHVVAEQPAMLRDRHSIGALLAFYSYFNKLYNVNRRIWHDPYQKWNSDASNLGENPDLGSVAWNKLSRAGSLSGSIAQATGRTVATLVVANVLGELLSGRGREEDEKLGQWLLRKSLASATPMVPIAGVALEELINRKVTGKHKQLSLRAAPAAAAIEGMVNAYTKISSNNRDGWEKFWAAVEATGVVTHTPLRQVSKTGSYVQKVVQHRTRVRGPGDFVGGVGWGETKNRPRNPGTALQDLKGK